MLSDHMTKIRFTLDIGYYLCKMTLTLEPVPIFFSSASTFKHKHIHQSDFTCWLPKLLIMQKLIPTTYTLISSFFIHRTVVIMTAVVYIVDIEKESHLLFWMQHLAAALHSALFSDTVSGEIGIWSSTAIAFPSVTVDAKWRVYNVVLWLWCVTQDAQV